MWRYYKFFILFLILHSGAKVYANTGKCTVTRKNISNFTFPKDLAKDRITAGLSGDNFSYRELYAWDSYKNNGGDVVCSSSVSIEYTIYQYVSSPYGTPIQNNGAWVFPTSLSGVGVSFSESGKEIGPYLHPMADYIRTGKSINTNPLFGGTKVKIWKIPGVTGATDSNGNLTLENFKLSQVIRPTHYPADTISNIPSGNNDMPGSLIINQTTFSGTISFVPGTCNFTNKTVEMGSHKRADLANNSPWVNASFTINCPQAWGYGMTATMSGTTANTITDRSVNTATKGIIVTVIPRNGTVDGTRGIIGLKPGGAEGIGIQLAWGDPATLPTTGDPAMATRVLFDQSQVVSNESFGTSGNTYSREIKMAARYIRTGTVQSGRADSSIEIIASYN